MHCSRVITMKPVKVGKNILFLQHNAPLFEPTHSKIDYATIVSSKLEQGILHLKFWFDSFGEQSITLTNERDIDFLRKVFQTNGTDFTGKRVRTFSRNQYNMVGFEPS